MISRLKFISTTFLPMIILLACLVNTNNLYADNGGNQDQAYLAFADVMPEVKGGLPSLYKKIKYPEIAKKAGISGKVYVMAFIDESGSVKDVKVIKGIGGGCDEAAVNAIKSAEFVPGSNKGKPVKVKMSLPINFQL